MSVIDKYLSNYVSQLKSKEGKKFSPLHNTLGYLGN